MPWRESLIRFSPGDICASSGAQPNVSVRVGRRPLVGRVFLVPAPPGSTSGAGKTNVGDEIERRGTRAAPAQRSRPGELTDQAEQNGRWRNTSEVSPLLRGQHCSFSPESTLQDEKIRTGQKNLHEAHFWRSAGGPVPSSGEDSVTTMAMKLNQAPRCQAFESSAVKGPPPPLFTRQSRLHGQDKKQRTGHIRTKCRHRLVAFVIRRAALYRPGGTPTNDGDTIGGPCRLGRDAWVSPPPESTSQAEK